MRRDYSRRIPGVDLSSRPGASACLCRQRLAAGAAHVGKLTIAQVEATKGRESGGSSRVDSSACLCRQRLAAVSARVAKLTIAQVERRNASASPIASPRSMRECW